MFISHVCSFGTMLISGLNFFSKPCSVSLLPGMWYTSLCLIRTFCYLHNIGFGETESHRVNISDYKSNIIWLSYARRCQSVNDLHIDNIYSRWEAFDGKMFPVVMWLKYRIKSCLKKNSCILSHSCIPCWIIWDHLLMD